MRRPNPSVYDRKAETRGKSTKPMRVLKMIDFCSSKPFCFIACILGAMLSMSAANCMAAEYFISPQGNDNSVGSVDAPWLTFAEAQDKMVPGDTLFLHDGTYTPSNSGRLKVTKSGTAEAYIRFAALNDGKAIIDSQNIASAPIDVSYRKYISIKGIVGKNATNSVVLAYMTSYVNFYRVSAYNANVDDNRHVWDISSSHHILLEDCVGSGTGRIMLNIYKSDSIVARRAYLRFTHTNRTDGKGAAQIYGSSNVTFENVVSTIDPTWEGAGAIGPHVWGKDGSIENAKCLGCVSYDIDQPESNNSDDFAFQTYLSSLPGGVFVNCVGINNHAGLKWNGSDPPVTIEQNTFVDHDKGIAHFMPTQSDCAGKENMKSRAIVRNNVLLNSRVGLDNNTRYDPCGLLASYENEYNVFHNVSTPYQNVVAGTGDRVLDPNYDVNKYGKGAYLMRPVALKGLGKNGADVGAEVLFRYRDTVLTEEPLWPWPMESRIADELGISVTWEANGGLWKTLDGVYVTSEDVPIPPPENMKPVPKLSSTNGSNFVMLQDASSL